MKTGANQLRAGKNDHLNQGTSPRQNHACNSLIPSTVTPNPAQSRYKITAPPSRSPNPSPATRSNLSQAAPVSVYAVHSPPQVGHRFPPSGYGRPASAHCSLCVLLLRAPRPQIQTKSNPNRACSDLIGPNTIGGGPLHTSTEIHGHSSSTPRRAAPVYRLRFRPRRCILRIAESLIHYPNNL